MSNCKSFLVVVVLISSSCNIQADQLLVIDIATNALKTQEKSEKPIYHKDVAQIIKQQLDTAKGYALNRKSGRFILTTNLFVILFSEELGTSSSVCLSVLLSLTKPKRKGISFTLLKYTE